MAEIKKAMEEMRAAMQEEIDRLRGSLGGARAAARPLPGPLNAGGRPVCPLTDSRLSFCRSQLHIV